VRVAKDLLGLLHVAFHCHSGRHHSITLDDVTGLPLVTLWQGVTASMWKLDEADLDKDALALCEELTQAARKAATA
jgi:hypothetical protein